MFPTFYIAGEGAVYYYTSNAYPLIPPAEEFTGNVSINSGQLRYFLITYANASIENVTSNISMVDNVSITRVLWDYANGVVDNVTSNIALVDNVVVDNILVQYSNTEYENLSSNILFVSGSLTTLLVNAYALPSENISGNVQFLSGILS